MGVMSVRQPRSAFSQVVFIGKRRHDRHGTPQHVSRLVDPAHLRKCTDPDDPWVRLVAHSMHRTAGRPANIISNIGASGPSEYFKQVLGVPVMWIPQSHGGCDQHGPDGHGLGSQFRDGPGLMAGVFWDIGEQGRPE
jgi:hypothetical protein